MIVCRFPIVQKVTLLGLLTGLCGWPVAAQQFQDIKPNLVSSSRATRTQFDYTYRVDVRNTGAAAMDVKATVTSSSTDTVIIDGELEFGDISAGQVVSSIDTFTIRQNREVSFDPKALSYQFRSTSPDIPPIANAGPNQNVMPGRDVQLDGSGSYDPDGTIVQYTWTYVGSTPSGLPATLSDPGAVKPTVFIGAAGAYVFHLVVKDNGGLSSNPATVTVWAGPVANAGPDQTVKVGDTVQLDGTASFDPEGRTLTFTWTLTVPAGSNAQLSDPHSPRPTFVADVVGTYHADLTVNNGLWSSAPDGVDITEIAKEGLLMCGDLISGSIDQAAQIVQYTYNGQANRIVTMTLVDTAGWGVYGTTAQATLFAPSGAKVLTFAANSQQQITLPETGTYLMQVQANNLVTTGSYTLGLVCPPN